jgi:hypothetical protein
MRDAGKMTRASKASIADHAAPIGQRCEWPGCDGDGLYRAPRSRVDLKRYRWFCLDHVREYNAGWNYYAGMNEAEVEADVRFDTVWQRPSWPLGATVGRFAYAGFRINDGFEDLYDRRAEAGAQAASAPQVQAMMVLGLQPPLTVAVVKARYKELVKRYHPDVTGGDKVAEERFKQISEAYRLVINSLAA